MSDIIYAGNGSPELGFADDLELGNADAILGWSTFRERSVQEDEVVSEYAALDGVTVGDAAARSRLFTQTGLIRAISEGSLAAARSTILSSQNAETGTLRAKGEAHEKVDLLSVSFGEKLVGSSGSHYQWYSILWRKGAA